MQDIIAMFEKVKTETRRIYCILHILVTCTSTEVDVFKYCVLHYCMVSFVTCRGKRSKHI